MIATLTADCHQQFTLDRCTANVRDLPARDSIDHILLLVSGLEERLNKGMDVLNPGCGKGAMLIRLAAAFPRSRFTGYDGSEINILAAKAGAAAEGLRNIRFVLRDPAYLDDSRLYDLVATFDAVHEQAEPSRVLANIARALRPGGAYLMRGPDMPEKPESTSDSRTDTTVYAADPMQHRSIALPETGRGSAPTWAEKMVLQMLEDVGFHSVQVTQTDHDVDCQYFVVRQH